MGTFKGDETTNTKKYPNIFPSFCQGLYLNSKTGFEEKRFGLSRGPMLGVLDLIK